MEMMTPSIAVTKRSSDGSEIEYLSPISVEYAKLIKKITIQDDDEDHDKENKRKLKEEIFGTRADYNVFTPDLYEEIGMLKELNLIEAWDRFSVYRQAEIIAWYRLSAMMEAVRRDRDYTARKGKK